MHHKGVMPYTLLHIQAAFNSILQTPPQPLYSALYASVTMLTVCCHPQMPLNAAVTRPSQFYNRKVLCVMIAQMRAFYRANKMNIGGDAAAGL